MIHLKSNVWALALLFTACSVPSPSELGMQRLAQLRVTFDS